MKKDHSMINKNLSCFLSLLIIFNSVGCYATKTIKMEEYDNVSAGDRIIITMQNGKKHSIIVEKIERSKISGIYTNRSLRGEMIEITMADIRKMELRRSSPSKSTLAFLSVAGLIYLGIELSKW